MFLATLRMKLKKVKIDDPVLSRLVNFVMEDIQNKKKMTEDEKLEAEAVSIQSNLYIKDTQKSFFIPFKMQYFLLTFLKQNNFLCSVNKQTKTS
jgi:hypothetical protein